LEDEAGHLLVGGAVAAVTHGLEFSACGHRK